MIDTPRRRTAGVIAIGIAGAGRIALGFHVPALLRMRHAVVAVIADADAEARRRATVLAPRATIVPHWEALLDDGLGVDVVVNCLPTPLHAASAMAFARARMPLYLEKPLAENLPDALDTARAWAGERAPCQIGFNFRFHPSAVRARELVAGGSIGRPLAVDCVISNPPRRGDTVPLTALRDLAVHHIDLARFLLDDEFAVVAAARSEAAPVEHIFVDAVMDRGVGVRLIAASADARVDRVTVLGERGVVNLDRFGLDWSTATGQSRWRSARARDALHLVRAASRQLRRAAASAPDVSYRRALEAFLNAYAIQRPPSPTVIDGLRCAEVVNAAERVLASGRAGVVSRARV